MLSDSLSTPRVLVVEHDVSVQELLRAILTVEGYAVTLATTPIEAYAQLDKDTFHLILTDLFSSTLQDCFAFVSALQAAAFPTPIGVLTGWHIAAEATAQHDLAFLLHKPFDMEDLLVAITTCLKIPLSPAEEEQARVLRTFLARASTADWVGVAALCTEDVSYVLPGRSPLSGTVSGKAAFCAYLQAGLAQFPGLRLEEVLVSRHPQGMTARYRMRWDAGDRSPQLVTAALLVEFAGERIRRVEARTNEERLTMLVSPATPTALQPSDRLVPPHRVLLLTADVGTGASLAEILLGQGYEVTQALSNEEARALLEERCFHLLLADLPSGSLFSRATLQLLRWARPTPVGVLRDQRLPPSEAVERGFAFDVPKPVELVDLQQVLQRVITPPLSDEQQRQVELVRSFFSAIETADWASLAPLCHPDFVCYPPPQSKAASVRELRGTLAYCAYQDTVRQRYPGYHAEEEVLYPSPQGIAARYRFGWNAPEGHLHRLTLGKFVRCTGERISEMRLWIPAYEERS